MSGTGQRFLDWSVGSIVGNIVWGAVAAIGLFYFNESTGCVYIVLDSMRGHELELAGWTIAFALFGALVGLMVRHRVAIGQLKTKDDEIAELEKRPTQEDVDDLKAAHAEEIAAKDAEIERLCSPVEAVRRAISGLPGNELAMVGTLRKGPLKTSGYVETLSHLASLGIAEKLEAPEVFTPTWGLTSSAIDALGEDERLSKSAAEAAADGVRDLEAERYISSLISKLPEEQLGAVYVMHDRGFFDYRAVDNDPWGYERNRGADDLRALESAGIAEYRTLGDGKRRWTLTERAARVIDDDPTLVEEGRRYFDGVVGGGDS